jgi:hypothetical protein
MKNIDLLRITSIRKKSKWKRVKKSFKLYRLFPTKETWHVQLTEKALDSHGKGLQKGANAIYYRHLKEV